jgi:hypothetical protein
MLFHSLVSLSYSIYRPELSRDQSHAEHFQKILLAIQHRIPLRMRRKPDEFVMQIRHYLELVEVPLAFEVEVIRLVDDAETFGVDSCVEDEVPLDFELDLDDAETFDVVVCLEEDELERGVDALDEVEVFVDVLLVLLVLLVVVLVIDDELLVFETLEDFDVDGLI